MLNRLAPVLAVLAAFLGGCASQLPRIGDADPSSAGYVVVSIATDKSHTYYSRHSWTYHTQDDTAMDVFAWNVRKPFGFGSSYDFDLPEIFGEVQVRALPPGKYHLVNFKISEDRGVFVRTWWGRMPFSIPFTVERGRITYLGEFRTRSASGRNAFGIRVSEPRYFEVTDQMERDIFYARKKQPALAAGTVLKQVPLAGATLPSYILNNPAIAEELPPLGQSSGGAAAAKSEGNKPPAQ